MRNKYRIKKVVIHDYCLPTFAYRVQMRKFGLFWITIREYREMWYGEDYSKKEAIDLLDALQRP